MSPNIKHGLIVEYDKIFQKDIPKNRLGLLDGISPLNVILEIVLINNFLGSKFSLEQDTSTETQLALLKIFTSSKWEYFRCRDRLSQISHEYSTDKLVLFNRTSCLFALEELLNKYDISNLTIDKPPKANYRQKILEYLLCINKEMTKLEWSVPDDGEVTLEKINARILATNELVLLEHPFFLIYRAINLFRYLLKETKLSAAFTNFCKETYGLSPYKFCSFIMLIYKHKDENDENYSFYHRVLNKDIDKFQRLSIRHSNEKSYNLLNIRKSPIIRIGTNVFIMADSRLLLDKLYNMLLNDLWFDYIKPNDIIPIDEYRGIFGLFFENYIYNLLNIIFNNYRYATYKTSSETMVGNNELSDVYLRYNNKVLIAEIKGTTLYDSEKYSGNLKSFYKGNKTKFFKNYGINQLVQALRDLSHFKEIDPKLRLNKTIWIYPLLILNDPAMRTPYMAQVFEKRFNELKSELDLGKKVKVKRLLVMHAGDLERLVDHLRDRPKEIWNLWNKHFNTKFNSPFISTMNKYYPETKFPKQFTNYILEQLNSQ